jgi:transcriptional regulator with PAS, ATPase and Fis domain
MMLLAETGSRDESLAQVIHHNGSLEVGPFIGVNFTTIPKESFESQWFGFERGASTGTN